MKRFGTLFALEYRGLFPPLCALIGVLCVLENVLFSVTRASNKTSVALGHVLDMSGVPIVFAAVFAAFLGLVAFRFMRGYAPSKSMYALLILPVRRTQVYGAKLAAALLAALTLIAAQIGVLLMLRGLYQAIPYVELPNGAGGFRPVFYEARYTSLYLALLESKFLRIFFPPDAYSMIFSVTVLLGLVCMAVSIPALIKVGWIWQSLLLMVSWAFLAIISFPLAGHPLWVSNLLLMFLLWSPILSTFVGSRVFHSGEVAG